MGCHHLLQETCPTQGLNPGLLHYRQTLSRLSQQGSSSVFLAAMQNGHSVWGNLALGWQGCSVSSCSCCWVLSTRVACAPGSHSLCPAILGEFPSFSLYWRAAWLLAGVVRGLFLPFVQLLPLESQSGLAMKLSLKEGIVILYFLCSAPFASHFVEIWPRFCR